MRKIHGLCARLAASDLPVVIEGETGMAMVVSSTRSESPGTTRTSTSAMRPTKVPFELPRSTT